MAHNPESALKVVFGAMTFGRPGKVQARITELDDCSNTLDVLQKYGHNEIDTARIYADGTSEEYLGQLHLQDRGIITATKLSPLGRVPAMAAAFTIKMYTHEPGDLKPALQDSLAALQAEKVNLLYLHGPDRGVPYEDTFRELNNLYSQGYFRRLGISNYPAWEVAQICEICIRNGWKKPDVYQGVYNSLQRNIEAELLPCLRKYGISFYAYNPLAGGLLTDRYKRAGTDSEDSGGRFVAQTWQSAGYRQRYWNDAHFDALDKIRPLAQKLGIPTAEAALRWMNHHSALKREHEDAIITCASSAKQLEENLISLTKGPLPEELVQAFTDGWTTTKGVSAAYFF
ncbi:hypothetical protein V495_07161 [Pseudogymnoascus sp. VKM F-4514 (FW-929)]|nr:hypothetical protein V495_07161 [Pseudogymnoascus sp. VKM F-4514 (FW-929)]KFY59586.1 hypothetical protein V497_04216 [Pseudogymnoascus sp. VKM F-4516 (FW-969)]